MDMLSILLLFSAFLIIAVFFKKRFKMWMDEFSQFEKKLDLIPGPARIPIIGNSLGFIFRPPNEYLDELNSIVKVYHPFFRLWNGPLMGTVHCTSWKYAEAIFNSSQHIEKNFFYTFLNPWLGTGLLTSTGEKWHSRRKLITPAFHRSVLESYHDMVCEKSVQLLKKLKTKEGPEPFDITSFIWQCSLDIICETAMGTKMNIQEHLNENEAAYLAAIQDVCTIFGRRSVQPWIHPNIIFNLAPIGRRFNKNVKNLHSFTNKVIQVRKAEYFKSLEEKSMNEQNENTDKKKKHKAFLDLLIEASYSDGPEKQPVLSDKDIREEVDTFMFEGHDTTASALSWALYLLGRHPEIQEKVVQELDEVLGEDMIITSQKLSDLRLLERCIKETLRLFPSVPFVARKLREEVKLGEYTIPSQTEVFLLIYFIHRDPEVFPNPEIFNPDNFLPEACEKRHPFAYVPFSAGARNCIGQKFAMLEQKIVLSHILKHYRIEAVEVLKDMPLRVEIIIRAENGINVRLHPRNRGSSKLL